MKEHKSTRHAKWNHKQQRKIIIFECFHLWFDIIRIFICTVTFLSNEMKLKKNYSILGGTKNHFSCFSRQNKMSKQFSFMSHSYILNKKQEINQPPSFREIPKAYFKKLLPSRHNDVVTTLLRRCYPTSL